LKLAWSALALRDFEEATDYIAQDNPLAAQQIAERILTATQKLSDYPFIGHPGDDEDTREWLVGTRRTCWCTRSTATRCTSRGSGIRVVTGAPSIRLTGRRTDREQKGLK